MDRDDNQGCNNNNNNTGDQQARNLEAERQEIERMIARQSEASRSYSAGKFSAS